MHALLFVWVSALVIFCRPSSSTIISMKTFYFLASMLLTSITGGGGTGGGGGTPLLATVGDDLQTIWNHSCRAGEGWELIHRLSDNSARTVASSHAGGDFAPPLLRDVGMNDVGLYELSCGSGGADAAPRELLVGAPVEVRVAAGSAAALPCHSVTVGVSGLSVEWSKKGDGEVLRVSGGSPPGRGSPPWGSRVSLRADWERRGDLSLKVAEVEERHGGDYFCLVTADVRRSLAAVVRLIVIPSIPDPETTPGTGTEPTPQKLPGDDGCLHTGVVTGVVTATVSILITLLLTGLRPYLKKKHNRALKLKAAGESVQLGRPEDKNMGSNETSPTEKDAEAGRALPGSDTEGG